MSANSKIALRFSNPHFWTNLVRRNISMFVLIFEPSQKSLHSYLDHPDTPRNSGYGDSSSCMSGIYPLLPDIISLSTGWNDLACSKSLRRKTEIVAMILFIGKVKFSTFTYSMVHEIVHLDWKLLVREIFMCFEVIWMVHVSSHSTLTLKFSESRL